MKDPGGRLAASVLVAALAMTYPPPAAAHDGDARARVAFVRLDETGGSDLYSVDVDGQDERLLTGASSWPDNSFPQASPAGDHIAFMCGEYGQAVCVTGADGGEVTELTPSWVHFADFSWSPDGSRIAYVLGRRWHSEIFVVDADGRHRRELTHGELNHGNAYPAWSPDGRTLVYSSNPHGRAGLFALPVDGGPPRRLTRAPLGYDDLSASWSPDGTKILFARMGLSTPESSLYVLDLETHSLQPLATSRPAPSGPRWSPDGTRIAFLDHDEGAIGRARRLQIYTLAADGSNEAQATHDDHDHVFFEWSGDGRFILCDGDTGLGDTGILLVDPRGRYARTVTRDLGVESLPTWLGSRP